MPKKKEPKKTKNFARIFGAQPGVPHASIVSIESDVGKGLHAFSVVGLPDKAVEEARDRISSAIKNSGEYKPPKSSSKKIVISLAPAALKKEGAVFDVPMALSYLSANDDIKFSPKSKLFAGELALDGTLRPIRGALSIALAAKESGFDSLYVPTENAREAALVDGIKVFGVHNLQELIEHLSEEYKTRINPEKRRCIGPGGTQDDMVLESIRGQENAKRALEIAAAGRHNIAFYGPPGTGKTLLARAIASLLPPLSRDEVVEITGIHSFAGELDGDIITIAPFRAPHHTASYVSLVGGGTVPRPGEVTLAHRGVLFMDEFPEFSRDVVNALRQPMEDRVVTVSRAKGTAAFPANFMLVAALNPCPCGHYGTARCECPGYQIERYRRKISGPIADRIDLWVHVGSVSPEDLSARKIKPTGETKKARDNVMQASGMQTKRFANTKLFSNSDMGARDIEDLAGLSKDAEKALQNAAISMGISARGYHRTIKVARTVADMAGSEQIEPDHMTEALSYRQKE